MFKWITVLVATATMAVVATAASAATSIDWTLTGTAVWSSITTDDFVHQFDVSGTIEGVGTYSGTLNAGTYVYPGPNGCGPDCAPVTGTLTFITKKGTLETSTAGQVSIFPIPSTSSYEFTLTLTVTGGTRSYAHSSGTLTITYESSLQNEGYAPCDPSPCTVHDSGRVTGTLAHA